MSKQIDGTEFACLTINADLEVENEKLINENKILAKALELACESVKYFEEMQDKEMGFSEFFGYDSDYDLQAIIEQYKQQAEKELQIQIEFKRLEKSRRKK